MKFNIFGRGRSLRWAITFTCQIAFIFFGYDQGVMSGLVTNKNFLDVVNNPNDSTEGIMLSIYNLGCFSGCILNIFLADYFGRRRSIWFAMAWIVVGASLQASTYGLAQLMVGRFITGIGTGFETSTVPVYQSEVCDASNRGRLVSSEVTFIGVGLVISAFFDYGMVHIDSPVGWRVPVACQLIFALIVTFMVFGLPESPRYLYSKGRNEEAINVLCELHDTSPEDQKVIQEQTIIMEALHMESVAGEYSWRRILKKDRVQTGKRVLLAYGMQFMNQMGGINLIVYYMPTALKNNVGLSENTSVLLSATINIMFVIGAIFPTLVSDRIGRRKPMMWGSFGCGISMMFVAILLSFQGTAHGHITSSACVAFFYLFMLIYGATVACIPWVYVPEILPLNVRAKGSAIAISSNWIWNFFIVMITPTLINNLRWKAYLIFMCLNFAFIPVVYFFYPETANFTLEEINLLYAEHDTPARLVAKRYQKQVKESGQGVMESKQVFAREVEATHHEIET
ncbi:hypothetical protein TCE0_015f03161 [Talaromyces pinophilus]|uniref:Major facilitator superfamily (MFS) profile domain-containing protein n=1 Tax=Talaromyces pinophilus TaxID=128442 RepID=A0A6V8H1D0_TALPI|nr:hypothetical protein TCE0_015f03161 [Talaromyces pinophilus]